MTLAIPQPVRPRKVFAPALPPPPPGMHALMRDALRGELEIVPLNVAQYHALGEAGFEDGSVELLNGLLVRKMRGSAENPMGHNLPHQIALLLIEQLDGRLKGRGAHRRSQMPLVVWDKSEPEPDGAIVRGSVFDDMEATPTTADVSCIIEASDTSLRYDRTHKVELYARREVPQYVILNLVDDVIEVREDPDADAGVYRRLAVAWRGDTIQLLMPDGTKLDVAASDLIPPRRP